MPSRNNRTHYGYLIHYKLYCGKLVRYLAVSNLCHQYQYHKWGPPCKRVVSGMELNCNNVLSIKFHNKSWAAKGCWESPKGHLAAQDLLLNLIIKTLLLLCCMFLQYFFINMFSSITKKNSSSNPATIFFLRLPVNFLIGKTHNHLKVHSFLFPQQKKTCFDKIFFISKS